MKCYIAIYSIKFSSFDLTFGYEVILGGPDEGGGSSWLLCKSVEVSSTLRCCVVSCNWPSACLAHTSPHKVHNCNVGTKVYVTQWVIEISPM